ncbi:MAG: cation:proton antiporter [Clostridia bacterium]|nr:cation:proton antiporter [Clostridia bacterium]
MTSLIDRISSSTATLAIISIACMLFFGFLMTRLTKLLRLPNVTAYIICGIILGPYVFNLIPGSVVEGMDFLADIALAFIAFSTSEFFKLGMIKKTGKKVLVITVLEAYLAMAIVFVLTYVILRLELTFSIVVSALASATAPASTMMTIRQTGAKGDFVDTLLLVIAFDNVLCLIAYSVAISIAKATMTSSFSIMDVLQPILLTIGVAIAGGLFGWLLSILMKKRSSDNRLIVSIAMLFAFCGVCALLDTSPLLGCMAMGAVYINMTNDENLFKQLNYFSPPIMLLFFVRSGLNFNLGSLFSNNGSIGATPLIVVGVLYFFVRVGGKYLGAFVGSAITKKSTKVRNYLGLALIPQAGVAIGLASLGARTLGGDVGSALLTIIMSSSVLYELVGPVLAKLSLYLSGSYSNDIETLVPAEEIADSSKKNEVELLIERIQTIQNEIPKHTSLISEEEAAFLEAAEEQYQNVIIDRRKRFGRR